MKRHVKDFAVLGGPPVFQRPLIVGRPNALRRDSFLKRIEAVLDSEHLTNGGPMVCEFEQRIAECLGVRNVIAVSNGTAALQVMAMACQLTGEVIVPSMTFIATAHALQWIGLTPVFADIDNRTHTLDPESVQRCITDRTSAILGVHLWGNPCAIDDLQQIGEQHRLSVLYDASHAFGCSVGRRSVGSFGDAEAFSFHATKIMHSAEGGAIATNNDDIAERCRLLRNFGITGLTQIESIGINAKMNELSAAAGLTSFESIQDVMAHNKNNLAEYRLQIECIDGLRVAIPTEDQQLNCQYAVICVDEKQFGLSRDELLQVLRAEGVFARAYFAPGCHNVPPYAGVSVHCPVSLPVTNQLLDEVIQLPTGSSVNTTDIQMISTLILAARKNARMLSEHMQQTEPCWHPADPAIPVRTTNANAA